MLPDEEVNTEGTPTPEEAELELVVEGEEKKPEEKPGVEQLTPEQVKELRARADSTKVLADGLAALGAGLNRPVVVQQPPINSPQETPEEFYEKNADKMFDPKEGAKLMATYTKMVAERDYGPMLQGQARALATANWKLLKGEDPYAKKYASEVEALVAQQNAATQAMPNVYELAWVEVRKKHQSEIDKETIDAKVQEAVTAALKEHGIDLGKPGERPAARTTGETSTASRPRPTEGKRTVRIPDAKTKAEIENYARRKLMSIEDVCKSRGYMPW